MQRCVPIYCSALRMVCRSGAAGLAACRAVCDAGALVEAEVIGHEVGRDEVRAAAGSSAPPERWRRPATRKHAPGQHRSGTMTAQAQRSEVIMESTPT